MASKTKQPEPNESPSDRFDRLTKQVMDRQRRADARRELAEKSAKTSKD